MTMITEPIAPGYHQLRDATGVLPYSHLITESAPGSSRSLCGLTGEQLSNWGVTQMTRCPECDIAQQLDFVA